MGLLLRGPAFMGRDPFISCECFLMRRVWTWSEPSCLLACWLQSARALPGGLSTGRNDPFRHPFELRNEKIRQACLAYHKHFSSGLIPFPNSLADGMQRKISSYFKPVSTPKARRACCPFSCTLNNSWVAYHQIWLSATWENRAWSSTPPCESFSVAIRNLQ